MSASVVVSNTMHYYHFVYRLTTIYDADSFENSVWNIKICNVNLPWVHCSSLNSPGKRKNKLNICTFFIFSNHLNVVFQLDEYFKQKRFDRVHLRVVACCVSVQWFGGLHAWSTLAAEWQRENGLCPAEIMELVCSP